jgi:hypothetical protein
MFYGPLADNVSSHWSSSVQEQSVMVQNLLMEMDSELYAQEAQKHLARDGCAQAEQSARENKWAAVEKMAGE